jgi:hypothetical protein
VASRVQFLGPPPAAAMGERTTGEPSSADSETRL